MRTGLWVALTLVAGHAAADDRDTIAIGMQASHGDYGSGIDTTIVSVPLSVDLHRGRWQVGASVPWLRVSGDRNVLPEGGPVLLPGPLAGHGPGTERTTTVGIGDLELEAKYALHSSAKAGIDVGVSAKVATADETRGLGTGADDYAVGVDLRRVFGSTLLSLGADHAWLGQSERITADTRWRATVGLSQRAGPGHLGVAYAQRSALAGHADERRDAMLFYNASTGRGRQVKLHASRGLSNGSPDWAMGVSVGTSF